MSADVRIIENSPKTPLCPHCEREVSNLAARKIRSAFGVRFVYFCDSCRKVLGVSHRKGFWMG